MKISDQIDVDSLTNVNEEIKPELKELLYYIDMEQSKTNSFTDKQINRMISELNSGQLTIMACDQNKSIFKDNPYLLGYYENTNNTKTIVVKNTKDKISSLSHEWEHFLVDEIPAHEINQYANIQFDLEKKIRNNEENSIYNTEFNNNEKHNNRGAFHGDYSNSKWLRMWNEAATEIISSDRIGLPTTGYSSRVNFVNAIIKLNGKTIDDLRQAYREGNLDFIYGLMPKNYLINISKFENQLYESASCDDKKLIGMNNCDYAGSMIEDELNNYINDISHTDIYKSMSEREQIEIFEKISNLQYTGNSKKNQELNIFNKLDFKVRRVVKSSIENCKNSQEVFEKIEDWYKEQGIHEFIGTVSRVQMTILRGIAVAKNDLGEDTASIDDICTEFENRLMHQEKIITNIKEISENTDEQDSYEVIENFDNVEEHFVYRNGERYLNVLIEQNDIEVSICNIDIDKKEIILTREDGCNSVESKVSFDTIDEFKFTAKQFIDMTIYNRIKVREYKHENEQQLTNLYQKGITLVKQKEQESPVYNFTSHMKGLVAINFESNQYIQEGQEKSIDKHKEEATINGR